MIIESKNNQENNVHVHIPEIHIRFSTTSREGVWVAEIREKDNIFPVIVSKTSSLRSLLKCLESKNLISTATKNKLILEHLDNG